MARKIIRGFNYVKSQKWGKILLGGIVVITVAVASVFIGMELKTPDYLNGDEHVAFPADDDEE